MDSSDIDNEGIAGANPDRPAFDDFMYHYEDPSAEPHDYPMLAQTVFHTEPMAAMDTVERTNTFCFPSSNSLAPVGPVCFLSIREVFADLDLLSIRHC